MTGFTPYTTRKLSLVAIPTALATFPAPTVNYEFDLNWFKVYLH